MLLIKKKYALIAVFILIFHLFLLTQTKFTAWPEMLLWPYLLLKGWLPYRDIAIVHNPALLFDLSVFYKLFGVGLVQLKIFTWLLILAVDLVTFWVSYRLWNKKTALLALIIVIPLTFYYDANGLWFDLALAVLFPLIYYFSLNKKYLWAGVFWALAFFTKQTAVWLLIPVLLSLKEKPLLKFKNTDIKYINEFLVGTLSLFLIVVFIFAILKILPDYLFWAYEYAGAILPFSRGQVQIPDLKQFILGTFPIILVISIAVVKKTRKGIDLLLWIISGAMGVYPRWELFHFLPVLPFIAFYMSSLIYGVKSKFKTEKMFIYITITIFLLLILKKGINVWHQPARFFEDDVIKTTEFIKKNTSDDSKIFVLNSWEHFYALTDTLPATRPLIPQFSWYLEVPNAEEKMLADLVAEKPEYIIFHPYSGSGLDSYRPGKLATFVEKFYYPSENFGSFRILKKR